ncbi:MAG TPA: fibronectin type III domain-containing protein, partial [Mycobacteriales bacterium]|nr:fibronectin type III domain-containing protein [Mycobacteriales bacterium]
PKAPHSLAVVPGPASATVSWVPGNDGSARTTSYTVTSDPGGITATVNGSTNSATVTGLDPATTYTFTVTAKSAAGTSLPSAPTSAITPIVGSELAVLQPASINYGSPLAVSAVLRRKDTAAGIAGQQVAIFRRGPGSTTWVARGTATTGSDGSVEFKLHPTRTIQVKLVYQGADGFKSVNETTTTTVHYVVAAALSAGSVRHGGYVKLTGSVSPALAGLEVTRQQLVGGKWQDGPSKAIGQDGAFSWRLHPMRRKTTLTYRVVIGASHGLGAGTSPTLILDVR